jgi:hypothetical protein
MGAETDPVMTDKPSGAKRIGRPFKEPTKGKRAALGLLVRPEMKRLVDKRAKDNSRTQSQEAEAMLEGYLQYEQLVEATRQRLTEQLIESILLRHLWTRVRISKEGELWASPGYPLPGGRR